VSGAWGSILGQLHQTTSGGSRIWFTIHLKASEQLLPTMPTETSSIAMHLHGLHICEFDYVSLCHIEPPILNEISYIIKRKWLFVNPRWYKMSCERTKMTI